MDLTTTYLDMELRTPLVPSASPLMQELDNLRRMEDAGAAAVVLHSLFAEQVAYERLELHQHLTYGTESFAEALNWFPEPQSFHFAPDDYLEHIRKAKAALAIPVIASLNGASAGGWTNYAQNIEEAGADALELNIYYIPTDLDMTAAQVEHIYLEILREVKASVSIPVAVKLGPYFSSFGHMARQLDEAGADALVLFNRFYQPDFDLQNLEIRTNVLFSKPQALRLPLRWIAILYGRIAAQLAATSGIHSAIDVLKLLMAGADVTMLCSVLYERGIDYIRVIEQGVRDWMEKHEYESVSQMRGSMSQQHCDDPAAFERALYVRAVRDYEPLKNAEVSKA